MNLVKVYLVQSITAASNNLRLNAQQIEVVGLLRETIMKSEDLGEYIVKMKKTTELSRLAIRLNEIYNYLTQGKVDFMKISEQFREHSRYLIRDLNQFLENVTPQIYNNAVMKISGNLSSEINVDLSKRDFKEEMEELIINENNTIKEEIILEDEENNSAVFRDFEEQLLQPISTIDNLLKRMLTGNVSFEELEKYAAVLEHNGTESNERGFGIISDMHLILSTSLKNIKSGSLIVNRSVIESLRACLIVIAAVVRGKEVDITDYLNRAEAFGKQIFENKNQVIK